MLLGIKNGAASVEDSDKAKYTLMVQSTALPIGIYSNELKTYAYKDFRDHCQTWKQSRCLSVGWRNYLSAQASIYHGLGALISRNLVCSEPRLSRDQPRGFLRARSLASN